MKSVWNSKKRPKEKKKKNRDKKKTRKKNKKKSIRSLALVEHSTMRTIRVRKGRVGTCGLKVVVLDETTTMLAIAVVTTAGVAEKNTRLPENNHNGTHTKVSPVLLYNARSMHSRETHTHTTLIEISRRFSSIYDGFFLSILAC
jgi:hypothetical protein